MAAVMSSTELDRLRTKRDALQAERDAIAAAERAVAEPAPARYERRPGPFGTYGFQVETRAYKEWQARTAAAQRLLDADTTRSTQEIDKDLTAAEDAVSKAEAVATKAAQATPDIRTVNGVPMERGPDGIYRPVRVGAEGSQAGPASGAGATQPPKGTKRTRTERAPAPDLRVFKITEEADGFGGWSYVSAEPIEGSEPAGATQARQLDQATAQTNLEIAQQRLAEATSPEARALAQLKVDQARFELDQARTTAPVTLATAQTNLATAQQKLAEATSPEARRRAQLDLETAELGLERARTLQQRENLPQPFQTGTGRLLTFRDPTTGAITSQENPAYTPPLPQDPVAAYTQEATRYQTLARQERDRLLEQQRQGALTADQAGQQFQQWFADQVEAPLAGLRSAAETARRQEEQQQAALQRAEDQRVEALNRQRETLGYQAGEQARGQLAALAPQLRSPEFLRQQAGMVSAMSQRAAAPSAEAAANVPPAAFTPAAFDPAGYRGAMPDFGAYAKAATERALASISPAVAARIGAPPPQLPTGPALQSMLSGIGYQGPLVRPPSGVQPLPGQEAIDLNTGMARSYYSPTSFYDWRIPQG